MCFKMINNMFICKRLKCLQTAILEPLQSHFTKSAHKIAKSKYFVDLQNESDSLINSLSNDIVCWDQFRPSKIIGREGARTKSLSYSAKVFLL